MPKIMQGAAGIVGELWLGMLGFDFGDGFSSYLLKLVQNKQHLTCLVPGGCRLHQLAQL